MIFLLRVGAYVPLRPHGCTSSLRYQISTDWISRDFSAVQIRLGDLLPPKDLSALIESVRGLLVIAQDVLFGFSTSCI